MARKRNFHDPEQWPGDDGELDQPRADFEEATDAATENEPRGVDDDADDSEQEQAEGQHDAPPPTETDLESQGFTADEVRRLVVVSDRQAQSDESQTAEATLRRLRFTRWLIEHGMLDEWTA